MALYDSLSRNASATLSPLQLFRNLWTDGATLFHYAIVWIVHGEIFVEVEITIMLIVLLAHK